MKKRVEVRPLVLVVTQAGETREYEFKQESVIIGNGPTANVALDISNVNTVETKLSSFELFSLSIYQQSLS